MDNSNRYLKFLGLGSIILSCWAIYKFIADIIYTFKVIDMESQIERLGMIPSLVLYLGNPVFILFVIIGLFYFQFFKGTIKISNLIFWMIQAVLSAYVLITIIFLYPYTSFSRVYIKSNYQISKINAREINNNSIIGNSVSYKVKDVTDNIYELNEFIKPQEYLFHIDYFDSKNILRTKKRRKMILPYQDTLYIFQSDFNPM